MTKTNLESKLSDLIERTVESDKSPRRSNFSHINPEFVLDLYAQGMGSRRIAKIYNCSCMTILRQMKKKVPGFDVQKYLVGPRYEIPTEAIVKMYNEGNKINVIAAFFGVCTSTIHNRLNKAGIKRNQLYRWDIRGEDAVALYRIYQSITKVAERLGVSRYVVRNRLERAGEYEKDLSCRKRSDIPDREVVRRRKAGETLRSLAERYDTSHQTILRILDRFARRN